MTPKAMKSSVRQANRAQIERSECNDVIAHESKKPVNLRGRHCDVKALFGADLGMVARGDIEIVDDRERPPR
jgi:hypothetical protein